jgi:hypothetical protein
MMKKPTSKKMMPAKKAMMGSKMASAPMMKKGGSVKKYSAGGSAKNTRSHEMMHGSTKPSAPKSTMMRKGGKSMKGC